MPLTIIVKPCPLGKATCLSWVKMYSNISTLFTYFSQLRIEYQRMRPGLMAGQAPCNFAYVMLV